MTDTSLVNTARIKEVKPAIRSSISQAMFAAIISSYVMTRLSLAGVDFTTLGMDSELVKATIVGQLVVFFAWATPKNVVSFIRASILFVRNSYVSLRQAAVEGKE